jgi:hypothetical protein
MKYPTFDLAANPFLGIIDIYDLNDFDPQKAWDAGIRWVIHKMGQWSNSDFQRKKGIYDQRKAAWLALGGVWSGYFLPYGTTTAYDAFRLMLAVDDDLRHVAIDWEQDGSSSSNNLVPQSMVSHLAGMVHAQFGQFPLLYSYRSMFENMKPDPILDKCPIWLAAPLPVDSPPPTTYAPPKWTGRPTLVWQWASDEFQVVKNSDGTDYNAFSGSFEDLQRWFHSSL